MTEPETIKQVDPDETGGDNVESANGWKASVSLEFDVSPVLTWRGHVTAAAAQTAAARAIREAKKAYQRKHPRSWVCVLERV